MRAILLVLVCGLLGCKGKSANQTAGSATAGSGSSVAMAGSDSGSAGATGAAIGSDAGSAAGSGAGSAGSAAMGSAAATGPTLSAKGGLSSLGKMKQGDDEAATGKAIEKKIGLPGVAVSFDVMDVAGEVEREEGYWSVKRGEKELVQALRTMSGPDEAGPLALVVWTDEIPTADGIKVGDTVATLASKYPDLKCESGGIAETVYADIICRSPKDKELGYLISPDKAKLKKGKVSPDTAKIIAIGHEF